MAEQTENHSSGKEKLLIFILWVVLLSTIGGYSWYSSSSAGEVENCTVESTKVIPQMRRSPSYLEVVTSCGEYVSYNIAHRTTLVEGKQYTFKLVNGNLFGHKRITVAKQTPKPNQIPNIKQPQIIHPTPEG